MKLKFKVLLAALALMTAYAVIAFSPNPLDRINNAGAFIEEGIVMDYTPERILSILAEEHFNCDEINSGIIANYKYKDRMSQKQLETLGQVESRVNQTCKVFGIQ